MAIAQQGVEFIIKGKIAEVSPFLLIADPPSKWPTPYGESEVDFSALRTIDAQDLVKVHDTFASRKLDAAFVERFNDLRERRNKIMHSVYTGFSVHAAEVIDALLFMHRSLFPGEAWSSLRRAFLESAPDKELGADEFVVNIVAWELHLVLDLLSPAKVRQYFGISKKQRRYVCPGCYSMANTDNGFKHKLAVLQPASSTSTSLYCIACGDTCTVTREACERDGCLGNVIGPDESCLTCLC